MTDMIIGIVTYVIDGDTFDMKVTHLGDDNEYDYGQKERVRISDIDAPELGTRMGPLSRYALQRLLMDRKVHCDVLSRDKYGRVIAEVSVGG